MDPVTLVSTFKEFGPWIAFCTYFIWQGWIRENRLCKRLDACEDWQRNNLLGMNQRMVEALEKNTQASSSLEKSLTTLVAEVQASPCLAHLKPST